MSLALLRIGWVSAVVGEASHRCISTEHQQQRGITLEIPRNKIFSFSFRHGVHADELPYFFVLVLYLNGSLFYKPHFF